MSLDSDINRIMLRILKAEPDSPIAVFRTDISGKKGRAVDAVFANTIETQKRIKSRDPLLMGVFGCDCHREETIRLIRAEVLNTQRKAP